MLSSLSHAPARTGLILLGTVCFVSGTWLIGQDAAPAPAAPAPATPSAVEAATAPTPTGVEEKSAAPANPPAAQAQAPKTEGAALVSGEALSKVTADTSGGSASPAATGVKAEEAEKPVTPSMPDPLVAPLEEPPVPTDLITEGAEPTPTESVVVNLINRLVERGVLTQGDASELVSQAQRDAAVASQNAAAAALVAADAAMASEEDIVVTHIPEPVKERLREEIRQEILEDLPEMRDTHFVLAESGKEAVMGELEEAPSWQKNIRLFGDLRLRFDATRFPDGNDNTGSFPDFNRINQGSPFDVAGFEFSPQLNVDENRSRFRMRARAGIHADLGDGFMVGFRAATGNDNSPVSTNQTFSGNFNKYDLWIDQAFLRWDGAIGSTAATVSAGRFENPFYKTTNLMWDDDIMFDGLAVKASPEFSENVGGFFTAGAFPIFNSNFNFPNNDPDKFESADRYLYGAQGGVDLVMGQHVEGKFALGYHDFDNVQGQLSDPYVPLTPNDAGSTDELRPSFAQKGNSYMALRNITPDPLNNFGTTNQYQYFGLASDFEVLSYNGRIDLNFWEPFQVSLLGEYAMNLGYEEGEVAPIAVNNRGPVPAAGAPGQFEGGNIAWNFGVQFGKPVFEKRGDWNAIVGYRFVESDAILDAFADSDFGLGGTNMEGFTVGAGMALNPKINMNLRWMGANEIAGPPLKSDILMLDLNAKF